MRRWSIVAAAVLIGLALPTTPAGAAEQSHPLIESFTSPGPGLGSPEPLKDACGVAVDPGGRVFVSNYYDRSVYLFDAQHRFLARIPVEEPPTAPNGKPFDGPCNLALDPGGDLYVANWHRNVVKLVPTGPTTYASPVTIDPGPATGVAIDPTDGNVLVDHRTYVAEYEPSGAPVMNGLEPLKIGLGSLEEGFGVAVSGFKGDAGFASTEGLVYVADAAGGGSVKVFGPGGALVRTIFGDGTWRPGFSDLREADVAVDPADGHIYLTDDLGTGSEQPQLAVDEFSPIGSYLEAVPGGLESGHGSELLDAEPSGLAFFAGNLYVSSGNYFSDEDPRHEHSTGEVSVFGPPLPRTLHVLSVAKTGSGSGTLTSSPYGIGCGAACVGEFGAGATLRATPAAHSRFVGWSGCTEVLSESRCRMDPVADPEVSAEFEAIPQLPLSLSVGGSGTVTSLPTGIECSGACTAGFDEAGEVTLVAASGLGSEPATWSGCDAEPAAQSCEVTMNGARSVAATFAPAPSPSAPALPAPPQRTLSVLTTETGSATGTVTSEPAGIQCGGSCARAFADGSTVTLIAEPASGSSFLGWGGCDSAGGTRCTIRLSADRTPVAAFGPGSPGPLRFGGGAGKGPARTLTVTVPAAGELAASGKGIRHALALPVAAGKVALRLRLDAAGERALRRAGDHGLKQKIALLFTPFDGGAQVHATRVVTFRRRGPGR